MEFMHFRHFFFFTFFQIKPQINLARPEGRNQIRSTKSEILNKSESPKLKIQNKP